MDDSAKRERDSRDGADLVDGVAPGSKRCAEDDSKEKQRVKKLKALEENETKLEENETKPPTTATGRGPSRLLSMPEEITEAIVKEVGVADWQTLNWVCQKFRRITIPYLWKNTSVDFARRTGHSFSAQALGEMKVGLESGINFATQCNMAIVTNVIHQTKSLTLFVPGDRADIGPHVLSFFSEFLERIQKSKLKKLAFLRSQLNWKCWTDLEAALCDPDSFGHTLEEIVFPSITASDAAELHLQRENHFDETFEISPPQLFACTARISFQSRDHGEDRRVMLSSVGTFTREFHKGYGFMALGPAQGTSVRSFLNVLSHMGAATEFESISLEQAKYNSCPGIFNMILRTPSSQQFRVTRLTLTRLKITEVEEDEIKRIDVSVLQYLRIQHCGNLEYILNAFDDVKSSQLKSFHCIRPTYWPGPQTQPHVVEKFLRRISGLNSLRFDANEDWLMNLGLSLRNHATLEELEVRFGNRPLPPSEVRQIRAACPGLRRFSFKPSKIEIPLLTGRFRYDFRKDMAKYVAELTRFPHLEELTLLGCPSGEADADRLELIANNVHMMLGAHCEKHSLGSCKIQKIRIALRKAFSFDDNRRLYSGIPSPGMESRELLEGERVMDFHY